MVCFFGTRSSDVQSQGARKRSELSCSGGSIVSTSSAHWPQTSVMAVQVTRPPLSHTHSAHEIYEGLAVSRSGAAIFRSKYVRR